mmetsp:Transcript_20628/g.34430  ORF Transcript_20628/g.34430 Transcript_20628/m.34430 type:complete len:118 (+) Transcript_20628:639-992(+)
MLWQRSAEKVPSPTRSLQRSWGSLTTRMTEKSMEKKRSKKSKKFVKENKSYKRRQSKHFLAPNGASRKVSFMEPPRKPFEFGRRKQAKTAACYSPFRGARPSYFVGKAAECLEYLPE